MFNFIFRSLFLMFMAYEFIFQIFPLLICSHRFLRVYNWVRGSGWDQSIALLKSYLDLIFIVCVTDLISALSFNLSLNYIFIMYTFSRSWFLCCKILKYLHLSVLRFLYTHRIFNHSLCLHLNFITISSLFRFYLFIPSWYRFYDYTIV